MNVLTGVITGWIFKSFVRPVEATASRLATSIAGLSTGRTSMTKRQQDYQGFLQSSFWENLRRECITRDGGRCRRCNAPGRLQAHHLVYPDDWYDTTLDQLITLCVLCHEKEHGIEKTLAWQANMRKRIIATQKKEKKARKKKRLLETMKDIKEARSKSVVSRAEFIRRRDYLTGRKKRYGNFEASNGRMIYNPA